ncbi:uncharacterized protein DS421_20g687320 [Arachis hypogaea]|nr:uncharacterized protein DS421_20g687320 [Arachis hypogaea]
MNLDSYKENFQERASAPCGTHTSINYIRGGSYPSRRYITHITPIAASCTYTDLSIRVLAGGIPSSSARKSLVYLPFGARPSQASNHPPTLEFRRTRSASDPSNRT